MRRAGGTLLPPDLGIETRAVGAAPGGTMPTLSVRTPHGLVDVDPDALELGELVVSDDGVELEVVSLEPLRFEPAPQEDEDWGE
jgi:lysine biosynthesis protein LysW